MCVGGVDGGGGSPCAASDALVPTHRSDGGIKSSRWLVIKAQICCYWWNLSWKSVETLDVQRSISGTMTVKHDGGGGDYVNIIPFLSQMKCEGGLRCKPSPPPASYKRVW